jgi:type II secretory pathway component PulM
MKDFIKEHWFKIGILFLALIVSFSVLYYYLVFRPQQDRAVLQQQILVQNEAQAQQITQQQKAQSEATSQAQTAAAKEQQLEDCVDSAHQSYVNQAQTLCTNLGYTQTQIDNRQCLLSKDQIQTLWQSQNDGETLCATLYK